MRAIESSDSSPGQGSGSLTNRFLHCKNLDFDGKKPNEFVGVAETLKTNPATAFPSEIESKKEAPGGTSEGYV